MPAIGCTAASSLECANRASVIRRAQVDVHRFVYHKTFDTVMVATSVSIPG